MEEKLNPEEISVYNTHFHTFDPKSDSDKIPYSKVGEISFIKGVMMYLWQFLNGLPRQIGDKEKIHGSKNLSKKEIIEILIDINKTIDNHDKYLAIIHGKFKRSQRYESVMQRFASIYYAKDNPSFSNLYVSNRKYNDQQVFAVLCVILINGYIINIATRKKLLTRWFDHSMINQLLDITRIIEWKFSYSDVENAGKKALSKKAKQARAARTNKYLEDINEMKSHWEQYVIKLYYEGKKNARSIDNIIRKRLKTERPDFYDLTNKAPLPKIAKLLETKTPYQDWVLPKLKTLKNQ